MGTFEIEYTNAAKAKMEEAYGLTGTELVVAIKRDMRIEIEKRLKCKRVSKVNSDFDFEE